MSGEDILSQVIPIKEYPGRVRGMGFGVSPGAIFGSQKRTRHPADASETEELRRMVAQLYRKVQELEDSKKDKESVEKDEHELPIPNPNSVRDSCTIMCPEVIIVRFLSILVSPEYSMV